MRRPQGTGTLLIASAVLSVGGYLVLGTQFGWPAVLDEPGEPCARRVRRVGRCGSASASTSSFCPAWCSCPAAIGLHDHLDRRSTASASVAAFGVLGAFAQMLGWVRWPITVPGPRRRVDRPGATATRVRRRRRHTTSSTGMPGAALGEHLGWLLQGIWAVGVAVLVLRDGRTPRWFAGLGLVLAAVWAVAVPTATAVGLAEPRALGPQRVHGVVPLVGGVRRPAPAPTPGAGRSGRRGRRRQRRPQAASRRPASSRAGDRRRGSRGSGRPTGRAARARRRWSAPPTPPPGRR